MNVLRLVVSTGLGILMAACGGGGDKTIGAPSVATVSLSPLTPSLFVGDSLQMAATARDVSGNVLTGRPTRWVSDDPATVSVSATGMLSALREGETTIRVTVESRQASTTVRVAVRNPAPAAVHSIEIEPGSATVDEGSAKQYAATPRDASGQPVLGRGMHWTVGDPRLATVDGSGLVTALRAGATTVNVRVDGRQASAGLRVQADYPYRLLYGRVDGDGSVVSHSLNLSDAAAVALPVFADGRPGRNPVASPDGMQIAYVVNSPWGSAVFIADVDGARSRQITVDGTVADQPAWSPDGTRIAFRRRVTGMGSDIWVVDAADGGNAANLTSDHGATNQASPAWSPMLDDGTTRIAYAHAQAGVSHIWTMLPDGNDKLQVTFGDTVFDDDPSWSPDGDRIVFTRSGDAVFGDLYVVNTWGGSGALLMQLAGPLAGGQFSPAWSPDGRLIAFTSKHVGDQFQVFTVWADGTRLAQRTDDAFDHDSVAWLPHAANR